MTREKFIKVLDREGYSYRVEGNKIVVTSIFKGTVDLRSLKSLPPDVVFKNKWGVYLNALTSLPPGVVFKNSKSVDLRSLKSLPLDVVFRNGGHVNLDSLTSIPPGMVFKNGWSVNLDSLTSIPPGVEFRNGWSVNLDSLVGGWFCFWKGNIEGIDSNRSSRLLNLMISLGLFDKKR